MCVSVCSITRAPPLSYVGLGFWSIENCGNLNTGCILPMPSQNVVTETIFIDFVFELFQFK